MHVEAPSFFEVSVAERALLTLHELSGHSGGYNLRCALTVQRHAALDLLERAIDTLFSRHELLRSRFVVDARGFGRFVRPDESFRLPVVHLPLRDRHERDTLIAERSLLPFDLEHEDPARFELLELAYSCADTERVLLIVVHHVAADYASVQLLVAELEEVYQALRNTGCAPKLGEVARYQERVEREREYLHSSRAREDKERWASLLKPLPAPWRLPDSRARPPRPRFEGREIRTLIPSELTSSLRALARELAVTPYLLGLAAASVLLASAAEQSEIIVGTTVDTDGQRLRFGGVGYFVNTLPLRLTVAKAPSFSALVSETRRAFATALNLSRLPFASLVEHLRMPRDLSVPPVFQTMVTWLKYAPEFIRPPSPGRLLLEVLELGGMQPAGVTHDLVLSIEDREASLHCAWAFDDAVISPRQAEALAASFSPLLAHLVHHPFAPLADAAAFGVCSSSRESPREQLEL